MNTSRFLKPALNTLTSLPGRLPRPALDGARLLGWAGLTRSYSRAPARSGWVAAGALLGAAAALLFAPSAGRELRTRIGKSTGGTLGGAIGKLAGRQLGAHPVATTQLLEKAHDTFGSKSA